MSRALKRRYGHSGGGEVKPWSEAEARNFGAIARRFFTEGHAYEHSGVDTDNCGFCALTHGDADGPNYAGWARLYIEAKRPIPAKWKDAFQRELDSDNRAYAEALKRSIVTFGGPRWK